MRYDLEPGAAYYVQTLREEEFLENYGSLSSSMSLLRLGEKIRHCRADIFETSVHGSLCIPCRDGSEQTCSFYMDKERLLFISDKTWTDDILKQILPHKFMDTSTPARVFFSFVDFLIKDEGDYIDDLEEALNEKESRMLENSETIPEGFEHYIHDIRKKLIKINRYYEQIGDMVRLLADSPTDLIDIKTGRLYLFLAGRMDRLQADALNLREYSAQLYEMYQSRINIKQNKVMQFLTVITTIFMPLTLITGWYGMNFTSMPEIGWKYGYMGVIGLSVILLIIEYRIFRKKKWM